MISKRAVQTTFKETATDTHDEQYDAPYYLIGVLIYMQNLLFFSEMPLQGNTKYIARPNIY